MKVFLILAILAAGYIPISTSANIGSYIAPFVSFEDLAKIKKEKKEKDKKEVEEIIALMEASSSTEETPTPPPDSFLFFTETYYLPF